MLRRLFTLDVVTRQAIRHRFDRRVAEWHMAGAMTAAGGALLAGVSYGLPRYEIAGLSADEATWGWALLSIGLARLTVLAVNGSLRRGSPHLRWALAAASGVLWSFMLAALLLSAAGTKALAPFLLAHMAVETVNAFRAAQDARREDDHNGGGAANGTGG